MRIISFAWTTSALLSGAKTCTRRAWPPTYAACFHKGDLVAAYDRSPRYRGKQVAVIRLTENPYRQNTADAPDTDFEAEGLAWMEEQGILIRKHVPRVFWRAWKLAKETVYVVRFELLRPSLGAGGLVFDDGGGEVVGDLELGEAGREPIFCDRAGAVELA